MVYNKTSGLCNTVSALSPSDLSHPWNNYRGILLPFVRVLVHDGIMRYLQEPHSIFASLSVSLLVSSYTSCLGDKNIHWINRYPVKYSLICFVSNWIAIYLVDMIKQPLNNLVGGWEGIYGFPNLLLEKNKVRIIPLLLSLFSLQDSLLLASQHYWPP